jgi:hypothetical protein
MKNLFMEHLLEQQLLTIWYIKEAVQKHY